MLRAAGSVVASSRAAGSPNHSEGVLPDLDQEALVATPHDLPVLELDTLPRGILAASDLKSLWFHVTTMASSLAMPWRSRVRDPDSFALRSGQELANDRYCQPTCSIATPRSRVSPGARAVALVSTISRAEGAEPRRSGPMEYSRLSVRSWATNVSRG